MNKLTKEDYIERFKIHNNKYNYSHIDLDNIKLTDYIKLYCNIHGEFTQNVRQHTKCDGCKKCNGDKSSKRQRDNKNNFILKASKIHENYYDYKETKYGKNAHNKVAITCPLHGIFYQSPNKHLSGKGCSKCNKVTKKGTLLKVIKNKNLYEEIKTTVYFCKFENNSEEFFKVGFTTDLINKRLSRINQEAGYKIKELYIFETNMFDARLIEDRIIFNNSCYKYTPKNIFSGIEECFIKNIDLNILNVQPIEIHFKDNIINFNGCVQSDFIPYLL